MREDQTLSSPRITHLQVHCPLELPPARPPLQGAGIFISGVERFGTGRLRSAGIGSSSRVCAGQHPGRRHMINRPVFIAIA